MTLGNDKRATFLIAPIETIDSLISYRILTIQQDLYRLRKISRSNVLIPINLGLIHSHILPYHEIKFSVPNRPYSPVDEFSTGPVIVLELQHEYGEHKGGKAANRG